MSRSAFLAKRAAREVAEEIVGLPWDNQTVSTIEAMLRERGFEVLGSTMDGAMIEVSGRVLTAAETVTVSVRIGPNCRYFDEAVTWTVGRG